MGKIVMPKNSALLNEIEAVLKIYYEANDWIPNDVYKTRLKELIGDDQYSSSYTKKAQITSYFGFTIWEDIRNNQSLRRITQSGKKMYEALIANDTNKVQEVLMTAMETVKFGRDNYGCPDSNTDIEPPALFIRAILDLDYLTYKEFAWLLWKLEDLGANYTDSLHELRSLRKQGTIQLGEEANKYADCKPIMILVRWGFLVEDEVANLSNSKHIIIAPSVLEKYQSRLRNLKIYNIDMNVDETIEDDFYQEDGSDNTEALPDESTRKTDGENVLLYGVPGAGKSWTIDHEYCNDDSLMERLVFHPDYMYSDFVGQILPVVRDDKVRYEFVPGPFIKILKKAYWNPTKSYCLIIEEINRGNAPAIFGEVFQLLDRKLKDSDGFRCGTSEYGITNANIAREVYGNEDVKVRIPGNLSIIGTMNTSDQNVFTLDTAFQRRWIMRMVSNSFENHYFADTHILDTDVSWKQFCEAINDEILRRNNITSSEDKRLGAYFISAEDLVLHDIPDGVSGIEKKRIEHRNARFAEKVIKYLWDDAFKFSHAETFDTRKYNSLELVIEGFMKARGNNRFRIYNENLRKMILEGKQQDSNIVSGEVDSSEE